METSFEYSGSLYNTPRQALRAAVSDYLYASGKNSDADVAAMAPASAAAQLIADEWPVPGHWSAETIANLVDEVISSARSAIEEDAKAAFLQESESRETSPEILEACWCVSDRTYDGADRVWGDPTDEEALSIWESVTRNGLRPSSEFFWGAAGSKWARQFGLE